jgi:hypothetical protein
MYSETWTDQFPPSTFRHGTFSQPRVPVEWYRHHSAISKFDDQGIVSDSDLFGRRQFRRRD